MHVVAAIPFVLSLLWLVYVSRRLSALNARLRANLAGCAGYPISPSSRRPATAYRLALSAVPLRHGNGRAAERFSVLEMEKSGRVVRHVLAGGVLSSAVVLVGVRS